MTYIFFIISIGHTLHSSSTPQPTISPSPLTLNVVSYSTTIYSHTPFSTLTLPPCSHLLPSHCFHSYTSLCSNIPHYISLHSHVLISLQTRQECYNVTWYYTLPQYTSLSIYLLNLTLVKHTTKQILNNKFSNYTQCIN